MKLRRRPDNPIAGGEGGDEVEDRKEPERNPANVLRGADAALHPLATEAYEAQIPAWVCYFSCNAKVC